MATSWKSIIAEDRRLRDQADNASEALAKLRYDNTVGAGVAIREYARQVGIDPGTISRYVKAHELLISEQHTVSISQALVRANTSADRSAVVEAIAERKGLAPATVARGGAKYERERHRVETVARGRAERHGTSVAEEAVAASEWVERQSSAAQRNQSEKKARKGVALVNLDAQLDRARRALVNALNESHGLDLDDDERTLIADALEKIRAVLRLLDMRFTGGVDVDWDKELLKLGEGES
jgi:hypothetical protein